MSSLDVVTSLLRSAARSAASHLSNSSFVEIARSALQELALGRSAIGDAQLTRAVTRLPEVAAATVSTGQQRLRVDLSFADGSALLMALTPSAIAFAPGGAKELGFTVEPGSAALDFRAHDVVSAIAGEVARALWRPALAGAPASEHRAFVSNDGAVLVVDLRSVPDVRWALQQGLRAAIIEAIRPRSLLASEGELTLRLAISRL
jgi:hypothetical protein